MSDNERERPVDAPLNPALKSTTETGHDTDHTSPAPIDTASSKKGDGAGWPIIWLVVTLLCVLLTLYLVIW